MQATGGYVVLVTVGFQFTKDSLLTPAPFMVHRYSFRTNCLVRDDYLELVTILIRLKEIQLHWTFSLFLRPCSNEKKTESLIPALRLPRCLKIPSVRCQTVPTSTPFNHTLQFHKTLEWNSYRDSTFRSER